MQHLLLILYRNWNFNILIIHSTVINDCRYNLPEPVLRMSVKEVLFAGFYGWKTAKDQNFESAS